MEFLLVGTLPLFFKGRAGDGLSSNKGKGRGWVKKAESATDLK